MIAAENEDQRDALPLEFLELPIADVKSIDEDNQGQGSDQPHDINPPGMNDHYAYVIYGKSSDGDNVVKGDSHEARKQLMRRISSRNEGAVTANRHAEVSIADRISAHSSNHRRPMPGSTVPPIMNHPYMTKVVNRSSHVANHVVHPLPGNDAQEAMSCFATHDAWGIVDLGASKTVIGSQHVSELIRSLDSTIRSQLQRCPCNITFRFGNEGTLSSEQALVLPIGSFKLKIAVVPGGTPFLLSNTLMRALQVRIDCHRKCLSSPLSDCEIPLELTQRGLFLVNLNQLILAFKGQTIAGKEARKQGSPDTFVAEESNNPKTVAEKPAPSVSFSKAVDVRNQPHNMSRSESQVHEVHEGGHHDDSRFHATTEKNISDIHEATHKHENRIRWS